MLENKIKFPNRYNNDVILTFVDNTSIGILECDSAEYVSVHLDGNTEDTPKISSVDPEGGPMFSVGDLIGDKKVKSIKSGYIFEFE